MQTAAQFYRECKQEIKAVLDAIDSGMADLEAVDRALDCAGQLPASTDGLNEWVEKLSGEKARLEEARNGAESEWSSAIGKLELALNHGDCQSAELALKELQALPQWDSRKESGWESRVEACKKRGPLIERIRQDAQRAENAMDEALMVECINEAQKLGEESLVVELNGRYKKIGQTRAVVSGLETELSSFLEKGDWKGVLDKANRILALVPTHGTALEAKKKAERVIEKDDFPKKLIALAEEAAFIDRPRMALRYYEWAKEEAREPNPKVNQKIEELRALIQGKKTNAKTVVFVGPPSSGKTVMLGSLLYFLQTRKESDILDIGTDSASSTLRSSLLNHFDMGEFPPSTAALAKGFEHQIPEIRVRVEPHQVSKSLPSIELTLLDVAGEHFRAFDATKDVELDFRVQNYLRSSPEELIFVLVIPANTHGNKKERSDLQMLLTDFGYFLSRNGNIKDFSRILSFSKWDLYQGDVSKAVELMGHYPMLQTISPEDHDDVIKFKVGKAQGSDSFEWDEWSAELFARRVYRMTTGIDDDPWVVRKKKKWFKFNRF